MNLLIFAFIPLILSLEIIPALQSEIFSNADAIKAKGSSLTETNSKKSVVTDCAHQFLKIKISLHP